MYHWIAVVIAFIVILLIFQYVPAFFLKLGLGDTKVPCTTCASKAVMAAAAKSPMSKTS